MASNVRMPSGVDTDFVWPTRSSTAIANVNVRAQDGQDFAQRYEKSNGGGTSETANIRAPDGVDLSLKFTTAVGNPKNWSTVSSSAIGSAPVNPTARINFTASGAVQGSGGNTDTWLTVASNLGYQYQILHTVTSGPSAGVPGGWLNLDSGQQITLVQNTNGTSSTAGNSQIRRKSDGVVVCSGPWFMTASRGSA